MKRLKEAVTVAGQVAGLLAMLAGLAGWINQRYLDYLEQRFATKTDFARVESKLDKVIDQWQRK